MEIKVDHAPDQKVIEKLGVKRWPIWEKEVSEFPYLYDER